MTALKKMRKMADMTQAALAKDVNVSQPFLHDLENAKRNAKVSTWRRIAEALGCELTDLIDDELKIIMV